MQIPGVPHRQISGRIFRSAADVQKAWFDAIDLVETSHFFFIDDDDSLPEDFDQVLSACLSSGAAVSYTDEIVEGARRCRSSYSQERHLDNPTLIHHLAVCETAAAREALRILPRGHFWPEMLLYWEVAKLGGAAHIPAVGYLWNKRAGGLHSQWFTVLGMSNSRAWCHENR